jgi:acetolactate synthase-1/2/3 large subunit
MVDQFAPQARIIRIELDAGELSHPRVNSYLNIHGRAAPTLARIRKGLAGSNVPDRTPWLRQIDEWKKQHPLAFASGDPLKPQAVVDAVNRATAGRDLICVSGVGSHQQWTARHFDFDYPRRLWLTSAGHGAMGFDLPVALGAQQIRPDTMVVCLVGDGSLQMNIQELATVVSFALPVKIFVLDNRRLAIVSQFQMLNWNRDPTCGDKWNPDFAEIARAYGIPSATVRLHSELDAAVRKTLETDGPALLHCLVDPGEDITPMLLAGQTLDKMWAKA